MRILLIAQNFFPETGATPNRILSFLESFRLAGHNVVVITAKPNHPAGVIWEDFTGGLFQRRTVAGAEIIHTWVFVRPDKSFLRRILHYLSFTFMSIIASATVRGKIDVVLATSPPLFVGLAGYLASRVKRCPFVFDVRDLWPDLAVAMGELNGESKIRVAKALEHFIYKKADGITAVTDGFCEAIESITGPEKRIEKIANGTLPIFLNRAVSDTNPLSKLGFDGRYVVTFAGNIGLCQGMGHIVDAAEILSKQRPNVVFLIIGDGISKAGLENSTRSKKLKNIVFYDRVGLEEAADFMIASDALLVPLANREIYSKFIPSKLFDSLARGRPILLSVDGEARDLLKQSGGGIYYPAEDGAALARAIEELCSNSVESEKMGERGARYAEAHLSRKTQSDLMVSFLRRIVDGPTTAN